MRLAPGEFFGRPVWERRAGGLLLALSDYPAGPAQPWHDHAHPTLFLLLAGTHRDHSAAGRFDQPALALVYHPPAFAHAAEHGPEGMRGLNVEFPPDWLARHGLTGRDLGGYRPLATARARLAALRLVVTAFQPEGDVETQALELLEPLVVAVGPDRGPSPAWLATAEDFLAAEFRRPVGLREAARAAGVHPVHLARVFRRRHGSPVSEHLRALRLAEAGRLVLQGESLAGAAVAAGFADQPHFTRTFAAATGLTPSRLWPARGACFNRSRRPPAGG